MDKEPILIQHSYNSGDLLTILPGLKAFYERTGRKSKIYQRLNLPAHYYDGAVHPVTNEGQQVCMNEQVFEWIKPLILNQEYVDSFEIWKGQSVQLNLDTTRDRRNVPLPYSDIYQWAVFLFPELHCDVSKEWLKTSVNVPHGKIVLNRTERYQNPYINYYFLKDYQDEILFVGTEKEHEVFCKAYNLKIPYHKVMDFLHLADIIKGAKFFMGNQSMAFHIANGIKTPRILEVCGVFPNTLPYGKDGYSFLYQDVLEYYFKKLINES